MAPLLIPADLLEKRSTNTNVSNTIMIIIFAVVGGLLAIIAAIVLYVILIRRTRNIGRHSHTLSNTSAPLLKSKSQPRTESVTPPLNHFPLPSDNIHPKVFTATVTTTQYEQVRPLSREATPILAVKPTLSSLSIPSHSRQIPTITISPDLTSSESLYSQPSASTFHVVTTPTSMITQYAHIPETADIPSRVDTRTIGELLRERAKRYEESPHKVSSIERAGSVKPAFDSDSSDDDSEFDSDAYRQRRAL